MVNKESQRRKIEGSKKESKRQTRKTERESRGYAKKDIQRRKVESRIQGKQKTGKERLFFLYNNTHLQKKKNIAYNKLN